MCLYVIVCVFSSALRMSPLLTTRFEFNLSGQSPSWRLLAVIASWTSWERILGGRLHFLPSRKIYFHILFSSMVSKYPYQSKRYILRISIVLLAPVNPTTASLRIWSTLERQRYFFSRGPFQSWAAYFFGSYLTPSLLQHRS